MATPRRRLIRPSINSEQANLEQQRKIQKLRERLAHERDALLRWQSRLKRAFKSVDRLHTRIVRLEKKLTKLEG